LVGSYITYETSAVGEKKMKLMAKLFYFIAKENDEQSLIMIIIDIFGFENDVLRPSSIHEEAAPLSFYACLCMST